MPIPAYMKMEGIPGSSIVEGRENTVEVLKFDHEVHIPTDRKDGSASGTRVHGRFTITKNYDKSSPELFKYLCNGKDVPEVTLSWYHIEASGDEVVYYTHTLRNCKVVKVKSLMPDVDKPENEQFKHREEVSFQYEEITWRFEEGNIEYTDSWLKGR